METNKTIVDHQTRFLSPKQFAHQLSLSRWTVYGWLSEGRIRGIHIGRLVRIPETELRRVIAEAEMEKGGKSRNIQGR